MEVDEREMWLVVVGLDPARERCSSLAVLMPVL
jgi:hypothetical protein